MDGARTARVGAVIPTVPALVVTLLFPGYDLLFPGHH
jgi:hypothetical protein